MLAYRCEAMLLAVVASICLSGCGPAVRMNTAGRSDVANISIKAHTAMQAGNYSEAADIWKSAGERSAQYEAMNSDYDPQLVKMRAVHNTNIAWVNLLNGHTDTAKKQFADAIDLARSAEDRELDVRQARKDRTEMLGFVATLGVAAALANSRNTDGTPTMSPSQIASIVHIPKFDQVQMTKEFPGLFETDGVRFLLFPDAGWLRSVGKLISPRGGFCTGFLMSRSVFVTNAHCVTDESGDFVKGDYQVAFQRILGSESVGVESVTMHASSWDRRRANDWALLELDRPISQPYPFEGYAWGLDMSEQRLGTAGYASDLNSGSWLGVHWDCRAQESGNGVFSHKCRTWSGASGSPIFVIDGPRKGYVVGIHAAGTKTRDFDERTASGVLFSAELRNALKELIKTSDERNKSKPAPDWYAY